MAHINPMLEKLQQRIENYNKEVQSKIESVANRQKWITVGAIIFNLLILFLSSYLLPDDSENKELRLISMLSNNQLNILITVLSIGISFPVAALLGKNNFKGLKIDNEIIEPKLNFAGEWLYKTSFRIQSKEDDCEEFHRFKENMEDYTEEGNTTWSQNVFDLKIDFGITNVSTKQTKEITELKQIKPGKDSQASKNNLESKLKPPRISWQSDPAAYDERKIRWSFSGKIWWGDDEVYCNEFYGIESYNVTEHDQQGRPSKLEGHLVGLVVVGKRFFALDGISEFDRRK